MNAGRIALAAAAALLACTLQAARAQDMSAASFAPLREAAVADESAWRDWHSGVLLAAFGPIYQAAFAECSAGATMADAQPFSFVLVIGPDGAVQRLGADRNTRIWQCMRGKFAFARLPAPPKAPYHLLMHQRFREPPPSVAPDTPR
jgi:hypothetical protein